MVVSSTMTLMLATHDLASPQVKMLTTSIWILGTAFQMPAMPVATSAFVGPGEGERSMRSAGGGGRSRARRRQQGRRGTSREGRPARVPEKGRRSTVCCIPVGECGGRGMQRLDAWLVMRVPHTEVLGHSGLHDGPDVVSRTGHVTRWVPAK